MHDTLDETLGTGFFPKAKPSTGGVLKQRFLQPPFSVLNSMDGSWQARKKRWRALGLEADIGRESNLLKTSVHVANSQFYYKKRKLEKRLGRELSTKDAAEQLIAAGEITDISDESVVKSNASKDGNLIHTTSMFDPVLAELIYRWWTPPGGLVLDPFAGGAVRGIIAHALGRKYWGCDLRQEQVDANDKQAKTIEGIRDGNEPTWVCGDSLEKMKDAPECDFVFSCPPYGHLEQYSDDARDISAMDVAAFRKAYAEIIGRAAERLKPNRFACFVVGDYRDKAGNYCNLPGGTIAAFRRAELHLYNESILLTSTNGAAVRAGRVFASGKKLTKVHQNILVFVKGNWKEAAKLCPAE